MREARDRRIGSQASNSFSQAGQGREVMIIAQPPRFGKPPDGIRCRPIPRKDQARLPPSGLAFARPRNRRR